VRSTSHAGPDDRTTVVAAWVTRDSSEPAPSPAGRPGAGSLEGVDRSPAPPPAHDVSEPVVVYSSLRGLAAGAVTPVLLVALGGAALLDGGLRVFPALLLGLGLALGAVVLGDLPRRTEFAADGLTRICVLRRQHLPWSDVLAIERTQPGAATRTRNLVDRRRDATPAVGGGLVARGRGKRKWLLTDRVESRREHGRLAALVASLETPVALTAAAPRDDTAPTDLYRRRRQRSA
jgi:hypothetical protein